MQTHASTYVHACMLTCIALSRASVISPVLNTHIHAYMHTCIYAYMHTCIEAYMHTCIYAYMHTYIHAYMHTHTALSRA
jgi:hypothetical protein